jgi:hypothetical protein
MAATLEELEGRVAALERELLALRQREPPSAGAGRFGDDVPMIREARALQPVLDAVTAKVFSEMGIPEEPPVSLEELRRMMIEGGVRPAENAASREIRRMREE